MSKIGHQALERLAMRLEKAAKANVDQALMNLRDKIMAIAKEMLESFGTKEGISEEFRAALIESLHHDWSGETQAWEWLHERAAEILARNLGKSNKNDRQGGT
ncbi:MAG: hypothetical protein ACYTG0_45175 [Planctomycetota bacterium]|jgi:hypothetical protein